MKSEEVEQQETEICMATKRRKKSRKQEKTGVERLALEPLKYKEARCRQRSASGERMNVNL